MPARLLHRRLLPVCPPLSRMLVKLSAGDVRAALERLSAALGPRVDVERLVEAEPMFLLADIEAVSVACLGCCCWAWWHVNAV